MCVLPVVTAVAGPWGAILLRQIRLVSSKQSNAIVDEAVAFAPMEALPRWLAGGLMPGTGRDSTVGT